MNKCPYCNDTGLINISYQEIDRMGHKSIYPYAEPCYCKINASINNKFKILEVVGDVHPKDSELVHKTLGSIDCIFFGEEQKFLYIVKSLFLKGFMYKNYLILESSNIVEQYNVPRDTDGDWLTTSCLNQYDILVILFTTFAKYNSLKDCILEVIKNRYRLKKTTWIYSSSEDALKNSREYSIELENYFNYYKKINLENITKLKGYNDKRIQDIKIKKERHANDLLANK
jgi:hypothetical protein